jgi:Protein of unknown function (DUF1826)
MRLLQKNPVPFAAFRDRPAALWEPARAPSMTRVVAPPAAPASGVYVREVGDLAAIFEERVNLCVLERERSPGLVECASALVGVADFRCRTTLDVASRDMADLEDALRDAIPGAAGRSELVGDVRFWSEVLAELTGAARVGVRMQRLDVPMCPRFHVDRVVLRLVSTYCGPATEWLDERDIDRRFLGHAAQGCPDETSGLLKPGAQVHSLRSFDIGLFKGEGWPGNEGRGAVHRSPTAASGTAPRIVMTLDPLG